MAQTIRLPEPGRPPVASTWSDEFTLTFTCASWTFPPAETVTPAALLAARRARPYTPNAHRVGRFIDRLVARDPAAAAHAHDAPLTCLRSWFDPQQPQQGGCLVYEAAASVATRTRYGQLLLWGVDRPQEAEFGLDVREPRRAGMDQLLQHVQPSATGVGYQITNLLVFLAHHYGQRTGADSGTAMDYATDRLRTLIHARLARRLAERALVEAAEQGAAPEPALGAALAGVR